jgi:hypothetical protein
VEQGDTECPNKTKRHGGAEVDEHGREVVESLIFRPIPQRRNNGHYSGPAEQDADSVLVQ